MPLAESSNQTEPFAYPLPSSLWALKTSQIVQAEEAGARGVALFTSHDEAQRLAQILSAKVERYVPSGEWVILHTKGVAVPVWL